MAQPLRPTSILGTMVSLTMLGVVCAICVAFMPTPMAGILLGAGLFLVYRVFLVRELLCRSHRMGIRYSQEGNYEAALEAFERSERFWERHPLLDQWRWVLLGSTGPYSFLALARYNQAWCLAKLKREGAALAVLDRLEASGAHLPMARRLHEALHAGWRAFTTDPSPWTDPAPTPAGPAAKG